MDWAEAGRRVHDFVASDAPQKTKDRVIQSLELVRNALQQYSMHQLAMSFNGGKDCLVMLYLIMAILSKTEKSGEINTVYIRSKDTFKEVDEFVEECAQAYRLKVVAITDEMKPGLETFLQSNKEVRAIFVGIRRADPYAAQLTYEQMTDEGWPKFMRLHPVLEWEYDDVWTFLRKLHIPYCVLYDQGYTSLGGTKSTVQNPSLKVDGNYKPAYELKDNDLERVGRTKRSPRPE